MVSLGMVLRQRSGGVRCTGHRTNLHGGMLHRRDNMIIFGIVVFGAVGYVIGDQYIGLGWLGAVVGVALVLIVAALDLD